MEEYGENSQQPNKLLIPLAIIVAGAMIAGAIYFGASSPRPIVSNPTDTQDAEVSPVSNEDHLRGSRSAQLIVVEYSDTECPWCKVFHNTMLTVMSTYGDKVAWVYRHVPFHSRAGKEAEATECAAELGGNAAFWKYLDRIFEITPSNDGLSPDELPKIAQYVGLDVTAFNTCLTSGRYTEKIAEDLEEAKDAGVLGTPYSVIFTQDGKRVVIEGAEPLPNVKAKIDALLK